MRLCIFLTLLITIRIFSSCHHNTENRTQPVNETKLAGNNQSTPKNEETYISGAFLHSTGNTISNRDAEYLSGLFNNFGDQKVIRDIAIRSFLSQASNMKADEPEDVWTIHPSEVLLSSDPLSHPYESVLLIYRITLSMNYGDLTAAKLAIVQWEKEEGISLPKCLFESKKTWTQKEKAKKWRSTCIRWVKKNPNGWSIVKRRMKSLLDQWNMIFNSDYEDLKLRMIQEAWLISDDINRTDPDHRLDFSSEKMHQTPGVFIKKSFNIFFQRDPSAEELEDLIRIIKEDPGIEPEHLYYAFMTSDEYRFF